MSRRRLIFNNSPSKKCQCTCNCHHKNSSGNSPQRQSFNQKIANHSPQTEHRHRSSSRKRVPIFGNSYKKERKINYLLRAPYTESITEQKNPKQNVSHNMDYNSKSMDNNQFKLVGNKHKGHGFQNRNDAGHEIVNQSHDHMGNYMHPLELTNLIYRVRLEQYKKALVYTKNRS